MHVFPNPDFYLKACFLFVCLFYYKTPPQFSKRGQSLQGSNMLWPPLPGKAIKAIHFFFSQNYVSAFLLSTGGERLSFGNNTDHLPKTTAHLTYKAKTRFPPALKVVTKQRNLVLPNLFNIILEVLARAVKKKKKTSELATR